MAEANDLAAWLRLSLTPGLGGDSRRTLLKAFGLPQAIFDASPAARRAVAGEAADALLAPADFESTEAALAWAGLPGNHILTLADANYPQALLGADDPPILLYAKGRLELLQRPMLAVVGSRNATPQGRRDAMSFAHTLAEAGLTIVSGLALGIDAAAHEGALDTPAGTVAIVGTGADRLYPARNEALGRRIAAGGIILSEFPLGTPPLAANFPRRNRLIAGLALGCLVVEAAPRSGSLITARLAAEVGREVFAIPGSIHSPLSRGCHALIRQGAKLVESAQDILEELRWEMPTAKVGGSDTAVSSSESNEHVLTAMGSEPCTIDALSARCGLTPAALLAILLPLELDGHVAPLPGGLYQRLHRS